MYYSVDSGSADSRRAFPSGPGTPGRGSAGTAGGAGGSAFGGVSGGA